MSTSLGRALPRTPRAHAFAAVVLVAGVVTGGCGGSDVGSQTSAGPRAGAVVIGQAFTTDATGRVVATVRSGSEVVLSGKDSEGTDAPVLRFRWSPLNAAAGSVTLLERNVNTVSFFAPGAGVPQSLEFRLTVTDANGREASSDAVVNVVPVPDPNRFLSYARTPGTYTVVATTRTPLAPDANAPATATVPFRIVVERRLSYVDLLGTRRTGVVVGAPHVIDGTWSRRLGTGGPDADCASIINPRYRVPLPAVNHFEVLEAIAKAGRPSSEAADLSQIDAAELDVVTRIESAEATALGAAPRVCVQPEVVPPVAPAQGSFAVAAATVDGPEVVVPLRELLPPADAAFDDATSAEAYYRTIDDTADYARKSTLFGWLAATGFVTRAAGDERAVRWDEVAAGATATAGYTNNYDLGFGRDMYVRRNCAGEAQPGNCDVAAVVINYLSLEAAAKKIGPFAAVAMEYSAAPGTNGRRIVKFYSYIPDRADARGDFRRVLSINLDGRGEKFLPQACTVCHGGTPRGLDPQDSRRYANAGDVDAAFLPWDLDALLFADTDRAFSAGPGDAGLRARYGRSAQEGAFRDLNRLAHLTYVDPSAQPGRYALARELVEGWYGGATFPSTTFDGAFVPDGWRPAGLDGVTGTADDNPSSAPEVYTRVFAQYCRGCHVTQAPVRAADPRSADNCGATPLDASSGAVQQLAMACYSQFARAALLADKVAEGAMPMARLTMDRFWVAPNGGESAGDFLLGHLRTTQPADAGRFVKPGTATAAITCDGVDCARLQVANGSVDIGRTVALSGTGSRFAASFRWSVEYCDDAGACAAVPVAGADSALAALPLGPRPGEYRVGLAVGDGAAQASATITVADVQPTLNDPAALAATIQLGGAAQLGTVVATLGNGPATSHVLTLVPGAGVAIQPAACLTGCAVDTPITLAPTGLVPGTTSVTVEVRDGDGDPAAIVVPVTVTSTIAATGIDLTVTSNATLQRDLLAQISADYAARSDLGIELLSLPQSRNFAGEAGTATLVGTGARQLRYTPPRRFATHDRNGTLRRADRAESIRYRLVRTAGGSVVEQSNEAVIRVAIQARRSFGDLVGRLASNEAPPGLSACASCHVAGTTYVASNGQPIPDYTQPDATLYASLFRPSEAPGARNGRSADAQESPQIAASRGVARTFSYVDLAGVGGGTLANPGDSVLLCWPSQSCFGPTGAAPAGQVHTGGARTAQELTVIREWLEDGANNF